MDGGSKEGRPSSSRGNDFSQEKMGNPFVDGFLKCAMQRFYVDKCGMNIYDADAMARKEFEARQADYRPPGGIDICQEFMDGKQCPLDIKAICRFTNLKFAELALEFYKNSQGAEFEVVEALYLQRSLLVVPGSNAECLRFVRPADDSLQVWCHVCFTAKPKKAHCSDASPKHFFGELLEDRSGSFKAKYCSTFEPSNDPGFNHGCVFCPADQKCHPGADGYKIGRPPCYVVESEWV